MGELKPKTDSNTQTNGTALHDLQTRFASDMDAINAHILHHMQSDVPLIPELANYLIASGGKRIRPLLLLASTALFNGDMTRAHTLSAAVEFIHTATLLHDDVVDESVKRRGQDSANALFGNEASVLVGDFLFSRAFQLMVADGNLDVLRILSTASAVISEGEVQQLTTQNNLDTTLDDYLAVIGGKTAALFAAACEVGPVIADQPEAHITALRDFGYNLGMIFQITDDILDYDPKRSQLGKTVGDDFREGKMTAPVLFAYQSADDDERKFWIRTMQERAQKDNDLETAINYINKHDAIQKSILLAHQSRDQAIKALDTINDCAIKTILIDLLDVVIKRRK